MISNYKYLPTLFVFMRKMNVLKLLAIVLVLSFSGCWYLIRNVDQIHYVDACHGISEIARDSDKNRYLRLWSKEKLADNNFLQIMREQTEINLIMFPEMQSKLNLDWIFLGLQAERGRVRLNPNIYGSQKSNSTIRSNVKSISVEQGRMSIIIKTEDHGDLGLDWPPQTLSKIRVIDEKVSVYCGEH